MWVETNLTVNQGYKFYHTRLELVCTHRYSKVPSQSMLQPTIISDSNASTLHKHVAIAIAIYSASVSMINYKYALTVYVYDTLQSPLQPSTSL